MLIVGLPGRRQLRLMRRETEGPSGERPCRVSTIPSERHLLGIISELRRLNRSIALPLERDLKRAGCPPLERCEVLREIGESGDVHLSPVELQTRLAVPRDRMSRLIDRLAKDGYIERERVASDGREDFVVITDLGRRASKHASSVLSAALRQFFYSKETRLNFFYSKETRLNSEAHNKALVIEAFDTLFNKRDYAGAERFWSPTYIQHSAHISSGREGLFGLIKSLPATLKYDHGLIIAEGDYVIAHGRFSGHGLPRNWITADIVRIESGVLVEHWDVIEDESSEANSKSGLPMFGDEFPD
jgi:predicted SnoaL-like aldol condensation-catalyzing enzyme